MNGEAMLRKKEDLVSELITLLLPCTRTDCNKHKISHPEVAEVKENEIKINDPEKLNVNKNKNSKKRKNNSKESLEGFVFPKKTARPDSPTKSSDPVETSNSFFDLKQDVEKPNSVNTDPSG
ncbi:hypothetical protein TNCV_344331 [Trichonephila clavipes]|nr:hypothetical protein TNCV_344331 [Trichonephila clavipes]